LSLNMRHQLPIVDERILDNVGVAAPCDADWSAMKGDDRVRHCPSCRQNVYNLSAMSRHEAAQLVAQREGRVCIRMLRRTDGTLVTRDCRELLRRAKQRGWFVYTVALALLMVAHLGLRAWGAYALWTWLEKRDAPMLMGEMAPDRAPEELPPYEMGKLAPMPKPAPQPSRAHPGCSPNDPLCTID
jgi:hypothetical protein